MTALNPDDMVRKAEALAWEAENALDSEPGEAIAPTLVALAQFWLDLAKHAVEGAK